MKTSLMLSHQPTSGGTRIRALLRIEGSLPESADRAPLNISLVLDRSGSMAGEKLRAVKQASAELVRRLHPTDQVSVVAFENDVITVAEPGSASDHEQLTGQILGIRTGGQTNLSGGWLRGRNLLEKGVEGHDVNRLILLSDGLANTGITNRAALADLARQAADAGITTTTIGVGSQYDEELMLAMAEAGRGTSYNMESVDQAGGIFDEELLGLLSICAQNVEVALRPDARILSTVVLHSYASSEDPDSALRLALGDLYAREPRELLVEFELDDIASEGATPVASLVIEADVVTDDGRMDHRRISLPIEFTYTEGPVAHPEVEKAYGLLQAARARDEAVRRADEGDLPAAIRTLRDIGERLRAAGHDDEDVLREVEDLEATALVMEQKRMYAAEDRKYLRSQADLMGKGKMSASRRGKRG